MEEAIAEAASRLRSIVTEHGPDAVALYVSGQMTTEAQYLANKLAKGYLRTAHIESNSRLCMAGAATGYEAAPDGSFQPVPGSVCVLPAAGGLWTTASDLARPT